MANQSNKVRKIVSNYIKDFPSEFRVEKVFLFGSYATGKAKSDSDIDLVIISPDFKKMAFLERLEFLSLSRKSYSSLNNAMDIIGYTPEEFGKIDSESIVMRQAKKEGREIRV